MYRDVINCSILLGKCLITSEEIDVGPGALFFKLLIRCAVSSTVMDVFNGCETILWKEKERSNVRAVQMDNLRGLLGG